LIYSTTCANDNWITTTYRNAQRFNNATATATTAFIAAGAAIYTGTTTTATANN
jgi:hypothetical protein